MKYILLILLAINPINYVSEINETQKKVKKAFDKKKYNQAIKLYKYLIEELGVRDKKIELNLAHTYFKVKKYNIAQKYYNKLRDADNKILQSNVLLQLGVIAYKKLQKEEALSFFKESLLANQNNKKARFNYELLKKQLKDKNNTSNLSQTKKENKESEKTERQKQLKVDKNGKEKTEQSSETGKEESKDFDLLKPEKLEDLKLNREKAENILEALKNREIQYIQQLKRTKKPQKYSPKKPDW